MERTCMVISTRHTSQCFSVTKTQLVLGRHIVSSAICPASHESSVFLSPESWHDNTHLALACGYVRSLAWRRTWDEFSQVSPTKGEVKTACRVRLIASARFCLTLCWYIKKPLKDQSELWFCWQVAQICTESSQGWNSAVWRSLIDSSPFFFILELSVDRYWWQLAGSYINHFSLFCAKYLREATSRTYFDPLFWGVKSNRTGQVRQVHLW